MSDCCQMRRKVHLMPALVPEKICGIPDSVVLDFVSNWLSKSPLGRTEVAFRFCPWCGKPWTIVGETWEHPAKDEESGEGWKK